MSFIQEVTLSGILLRRRPLYVYLFSGSIWKIPQSPEAVLDQTLAGVCQMKPQSLHASYKQGQTTFYY